MTQSSKGVFVSYASEDAGAATRICEALRIAGIEVWFDQSELRGGDAWDQKIRQQIHDCALFVPIISGHTQTRPEGYFRLEWKLAVDRSHLMAAERAFLVPVVVDATTEPEALVPAPFREVQWIRVQAGEVPAAFVSRIAALLDQPVSRHRRDPERAVDRATAGRWPLAVIVSFVAVLVVLGMATAVREGWFGTQSAPRVEAGAASAPVTVAPTVPERSIAVLPFVDMSEKHDQEYFSDGLAEELIDHLAHSPELKVIARTSAFAFKGKNEDVRAIATKLGVANILEGSVRKSGKTLRVTAQLIRADDGYHLWSETFDRRIEDIFRVQDDIAGAVVEALKASLLRRDAPKATSPVNVDVYTEYLQGKALYQHQTAEDDEKAVSHLRRAVELDSTYAPAWAALADVLVDEAGYYSAEPSSYRKSAREAAEQALRYGPALAESHAAMANVLFNLEWAWSAAQAEADAALKLQPGDGRALSLANSLAFLNRRYDQALAFAERIVANDPVDGRNYTRLAGVQRHLGRLQDAEVSLRKSLELDPAASFSHLFLATLLIAKGDATSALREAQSEPTASIRRIALAFAFQALGRKPEADRVLAELEAEDADGAGYNIAEIYAQRGDVDAAFKWLEFAYKQRDGGLPLVGSDSFLQALHADPRWKPFLRKMNLPE